MYTLPVDTNYQMPIDDLILQNIFSYHPNHSAVIDSTPSPSITTIHIHPQSIQSANTWLNDALSRTSQYNHQLINNSTVIETASVRREIRNPDEPKYWTSEENGLFDVELIKDYWNSFVEKNSLTAATPVAEKDALAHQFAHCHVDYLSGESSSPLPAHIDDALAKGLSEFIQHNVDSVFMGPGIKSYWFHQFNWDHLHTGVKLMYNSTLSIIG